jgi:hypothetical protein
LRKGALLSTADGFDPMPQRLCETDPKTAQPCMRALMNND